MDPDRSINVGIVAPIRLYREGLEEVLNGQPGIEVRTAVEGLSDFDEEPELLAVVDVLLVDIASPGASSAVREFGDRWPEAKVVAFGLIPSPPAVIEYAEAGVVGYVFRDSSARDIAVALRDAVTHQLHCPPATAAVLLQHVSRLARNEWPLAAGARLTVREAQVLELVSQGLTNKEIAAVLGVAVSTVKNHLHTIFEKLHVHSRVAAVTRGRATPRKATRPARGEPTVAST